MALVAVLAPHASGAQVAAVPVTSVPAALVTALIGASSGAVDQGASYYVGALPAGWPSGVVLPASATIVGGMATRSGRIAVLDATSANALAEFDSVLASNGWSHPQPRRTENGFQSDPLIASYFCRDSAFLSLNQEQGAAAHRYILVRYRPPSQNNACSNPPKMRTIPGMLEFPKLIAPPGSSSSGGASHGGEDDVMASAAVRSTSLTAKQLLEHYAKQLTAAGWTATPAAFTERAAVQAFDASDSTGARWSGALIVTSREKALNAELRMFRVKP